MVFDKLVHYRMQKLKKKMWWDLFTWGIADNIKISLDFQERQKEDMLFRT